LKRALVSKKNNADMGEGKREDQEKKAKTRDLLGVQGGEENNARKIGKR